ncbi:MAG: sulfatase [Planctomycetes bacterium]|nr:sulfatase [Planctomycetota bacterium]
MTSATADARPSLILRGLVAGIGAGAFVGLLDASRALGSANELIQPHDAIPVVLFYAAWFAPCGIVAALVARRFSWPFRMLDLVIALGSAWFFVVAWANVTVLPGFLSGLSITVDLVAAAAVIALGVVRYRAPGEDRPHTGRWALLGAASALIAFLMPFAVSDRDDGPPPQAAWAPSPYGPDGGRQKLTRPNVLLYVVDTLRHDHLSSYGYAKPTSPEVDAFAADATRFEDCRAATSWTKPSVASLMTSMMPSTHACVEHREVLVPEAETVAEVFRVAGWRTAGFSDNPFVTREFGFAQGFDSFDGTRPSVLTMGTLLGKGLFMTGIFSVAGNPAGLGVRDERGCKVIHKGLLDFVDASGDKPWFAYVQAMEPHLPYEPSIDDAVAMGFPQGERFAAPPRFTGMLPFMQAPEPDPAYKAKIIAQYDGEIRGWSRQFGVVIEELRKRGRLADTVIVLASDHGEEFHEHGGWTHGHSLHREVMQVPLVIRLPDALCWPSVPSRGRVVEGTATLLDIAPTLVDLCQIRYPRGEEATRVGRTLRPELVSSEGKKVSKFIPSTRPILGEVTVSPMALRSLKDGRWMLLRSSSPLQTFRSLYDDVSDPRHMHDKIEDHPAETREIEAKLDEFFRRLSSVALTGHERAIDPETAEELKRLGYTGGK